MYVALSGFAFIGTIICLSVSSSEAISYPITSPIIGQCSLLTVVSTLYKPWKSIIKASFNPTRCSSWRNICPSSHCIERETLPYFLPPLMASTTNTINCTKLRLCSVGLSRPACTQSPHLPAVCPQSPPSLPPHGPLPAPEGPIVLPACHFMHTLHCTRLPHLNIPQV